MYQWNFKWSCILSNWPQFIEFKKHEYIRKLHQENILSHIYVYVRRYNFTWCGYNIVYNTNNITLQFCVHFTPYESQCIAERTTRIYTFRQCVHSLPIIIHTIYVKCNVYIIILSLERLASSSFMNSVSVNETQSTEWPFGIFDGLCELAANNQFMYSPMDTNFLLIVWWKNVKGRYIFTLCMGIVEWICSVALLLVGMMRCIVVGNCMCNTHNWRVVNQTAG